MPRMSKMKNIVPVNIDELPKIAAEGYIDEDYAPAPFVTADEYARYRALDHEVNASDDEAIGDDIDGVRYPSVLEREIREIVQRYIKTAGEMTPNAIDTACDMLGRMLASTKWCFALGYITEMWVGSYASSLYNINEPFVLSSVENSYESRWALDTIEYALIPENPDTRHNYIVDRKDMSDDRRYGTVSYVVFDSQLMVTLYDIMMRLGYVPYDILHGDAECRHAYLLGRLSAVHPSHDPIVYIRDGKISDDRRHYAAKFLTAFSPMHAYELATLMRDLGMEPSVTYDNGESHYIVTYENRICVTCEATLRENLGTGDAQADDDGDSNDNR